jgi:hypothetical protein
MIMSTEKSNNLTGTQLCDFCLEAQRINQLRYRVFLLMKRCASNNGTYAQSSDFRLGKKTYHLLHLRVLHALTSLTRSGPWRPLE